MLADGTLETRHRECIAPGELYKGEACEPALNPTISVHAASAGLAESGSRPARWTNEGRVWS